MKNRPQYIRRYKHKKSGKLVLCRIETKRKTLYCYSCVKALPTKCFKYESGYGSKAQHRTLCDECFTEKCTGEAMLSKYLSLVAVARCGYI